MAVLGGFLVVVFNSLSDLPDSVIDMVAGYLESQLGNFAVSLAGMAIVLVFTYLLSLVLWLLGGCCCAISTFHLLTTARYLLFGMACFRV